MAVKKEGAVVGKVIQDTKRGVKKSRKKNRTIRDRYLLIIIMILYMYQHYNSHYYCQF